MCCGVTLQIGIESACMWRAASTVALIEEHNTVGIGIKKPAIPWHTSRTRTAMQDDRWLAIWIAADLPVDGIAVTHF